jgi:hypothetical protein
LGDAEYIEGSGVWDELAAGDALSFGASKGGALAAEAIVFFDPPRGAGMSDRRKRGSHLTAILKVGNFYDFWDFEDSQINRKLILGWGWSCCHPFFPG